MRNAQSCDVYAVGFLILSVITYHHGDYWLALVTGVLAVYCGVLSLVSMLTEDTQ